MPDGLGSSLGFLAVCFFSVPLLLVFSLSRSSVSSPITFPLNSFFLVHDCMSSFDASLTAGKVRPGLVSISRSEYDSVGFETAAMFVRKVEFTVLCCVGDLWMFTASDLVRAISTRVLGSAMHLICFGVSLTCLLRF